MLPEDFSDMLFVFLRVVRVDENVIKLHNNIDIEHISKDIIHKALEGSWSITRIKHTVLRQYSEQVEYEQSKSNLEFNYLIVQFIYKYSRVKGISYIVMG